MLAFIPLQAASCWQVGPSAWSDQCCIGSQGQSLNSEQSSIMGCFVSIDGSMMVSEKGRTRTAIGLGGNVIYCPSREARCDARAECCS